MLGDSELSDGSGDLGGIDGQLNGSVNPVCGSCERSSIHTIFSDPKTFLS